MPYMGFTEEGREEFKRKWGFYPEEQDVYRQAMESLMSPEAMGKVGGVVTQLDDPYKYHLQRVGMATNIRVAEPNPNYKPGWHPYEPYTPQPPAPPEPLYQGQPYRPAQPINLGMDNLRQFEAQQAPQQPQQPAPDQPIGMSGDVATAVKAFSDLFMPQLTDSSQDYMPGGGSQNPFNQASRDRTSQFINQQTPPTPPPSPAALGVKYNWGANQIPGGTGLDNLPSRGADYYADGSGQMKGHAAYQVTRMDMEQRMGQAQTPQELMAIWEQRYNPDNYWYLNEATRQKIYAEPEFRLYQMTKATMAMPPGAGFEMPQTIQEGKVLSGGAVKPQYTGSVKAAEVRQKTELEKARINAESRQKSYDIRKMEINIKETEVDLKLLKSLREADTSGRMLEYDKMLRILAYNIEKGSKNIEPEAKTGYLITDPETGEQTNANYGQLWAEAERVRKELSISSEQHINFIQAARAKLRE